MVCVCVGVCCVMVVWTGSEASEVHAPLVSIHCRATHMNKYGPLNNVSSPLTLFRYKIHCASTQCVDTPRYSRAAVHPVMSTKRRVMAAPPKMLW